MNKHSVNISSLVLLLSLLSFIMEVCIYYFVPIHSVTVLFAFICSLGLSHFFLEASLNYDYNFIHASFMVITSLAFGIIVYIIQPNQWIKYDYWLVILMLINWLAPFIYCFCRDLFDRGPRFDGYHLFFNRMCSFFIVVYTLIIVKQYFLTPIIPPYKTPEFGAHLFIPFMSTGNYLEEILRSHQDILPISLYIIQLVLLGIPFGFIIKAYGRNLPFLFRLFIYIAFPAALEVTQFITSIGYSHLDDCMMFLVGTLIGIITFNAVSALYQNSAGRDFMQSRNVQKSLYHFDYSNL